MSTDEIPTEALQAAARAAYDVYERWRAVERLVAGVRAEEPPWQRTSDQLRQDGLDRWSAAIEAAAPYLIAEGRRQAAGEMREWCEDYRRRSIGAGSDPHDAAARLVLGDQPEHWTTPLPEGWTGVARDSRAGHYWCLKPDAALPVCVGCMRNMTDWSLINPCERYERDHG